MFAFFSSHRFMKKKKLEATWLFRRGKQNRNLKRDGRKERHRNVTMFSSGKEWYTTLYNVFKWNRLRTFIQSKVAHGLTHGWPPPQVIRSTGQLREAWPPDIIHPQQFLPVSQSQLRHTHTHTVYTQHTHRTFFFDSSSLIYSTQFIAFVSLFFSSLSSQYDRLYKRVFLILFLFHFT